MKDFRSRLSFSARGIQQSVNDSQIGRTSTGPINDQELLFHKKAVGDDRLRSARSKQFGECC
ncbi:MAG: hypothetical protein ACN4GR_05740, partial [Arenicellales bacterium]